MALWLLARAGVAALRLGAGEAAAAARGVPRKSPLLQVVRDYARPVRKKKQEIPSHLDDLPPTMLKKCYAMLPVADKVDDVVRRMLSLEMATQREKVKIKKEQLADKVRNTPNDTGSMEVQGYWNVLHVEHLRKLVRIFGWSSMLLPDQKAHYREYMTPLDKSNKRCMLMALDHRRKLLKNLRNSRYDIFENTCKQLGIEYVAPPQYRRRATKRWIVKKALCKRVFQEVQKLKAAEKLKQRPKCQGRAKAGRATTAQKHNKETPA